MLQFDNGGRKQLVYTFVSEQHLIRYYVHFLGVKNYKFMPGQINVHVFTAQ